MANTIEDRIKSLSLIQAKSETVATTVGGCMIILPVLANMPMFADDPRLTMFKKGLYVGIFAPSLRQAQTTFNRMKTRLTCTTAEQIIQELGMFFSTSNGQTVALTNGSFATSVSASDRANIEGDSYMLIICEECQDISSFKIRKCLTGDTRVLLPSGEYKRLDKLVKDGVDEVVCYDPVMRYKTHKKPTQYYDNGIQDVYELRLANGDKIKATKNHQFYTQSKNCRTPKFRTVEDIIKSQDKYSTLRIGVPDRLPYFADDKDLDYERGLIIGYFMGDGCVKGTPKFIGDIPTCKRLHSLIKKVVSDKVDMTEYNYNTENGMSEVCFSTVHNTTKNPFTQWLKDFGFYGCTGKDKKLPDRLFSRDFYLGYIEGLIETDGSVENCTKKPIISFSNISEEMVDQLKDIYLKFGIHATKFKRETNTGYDSDNPLYLLHIKSVIDIRRFGEEVVLFRKQDFLREALETIKYKEGRRTSKYYPSTMRFYKVTDVEYIGKEHTYCLEVEGRNFIANNMISSNSIHPMGASYNATIIKIGTATTFKGDFYEVIERNKKLFAEKKIRVRNHFEYDYKICQKYNDNYRKYVEKEKARLGEFSDEFRMSYSLEWLLERGMFIDIDLLENLCGKKDRGRVASDLTKEHIAGIDIAKKSDSTVITIVEVDWNNPVIIESTKLKNSNTSIQYTVYKTHIKDWFEIQGDNYDAQYHQIINYLSRFKLRKVMIDATKEEGMCDRLAVNMPDVEVVPCVFSSQFKDRMYKTLDSAIKCGRATFPMDETTTSTREYDKFSQQMGDLEKDFRGQLMVCHHPDTRDGHDDYPDSWALAVLGAHDKTEPVKLQVSAENILFNNHKIAVNRNRYTAKRRR